MMFSLMEPLNQLCFMIIDELCTGGVSTAYIALFGRGGEGFLGGGQLLSVWCGLHAFSMHLKER